MQWSVWLFCLQLLLGLGGWDFLLIYPKCSQSSHRNEHKEPLHWFFSLKKAPILCTHPLRTLLPVLGWENRSARTVHPPLGAMQEGMWDFPGVPVGNFTLSSILFYPHRSSRMCCLVHSPPEPGSNHFALRWERGEIAPWLCFISHSGTQELRVT